MPDRAHRALACLLILTGLMSGSPDASAQPARTCSLVRRCSGIAVAHRLRLARAWPRRYHSHTGWRPVIPPFDQAEAEAEVHAIAPYRTYPVYPLFPEVVSPYPYAW